MKKLYKRIYDLRKERKLNQAQVAEHLGLTQDGYGKLERGQVDVTITRLEKLAEIFEVHLFELIFGSEAEGSQLLQENENLKKELAYLKENNQLLKENLELYRKLKG